AGLVGSLCAIYLGKRGYNVNVYEKRPDLRTATISAGKSINLVISRRGWNALEHIGIRNRIEKITVPVYGRMTHDQQGKTNFIQYSVKNDPIYSVSRGGLNSTLMSIAEENPNVKIFFNEQCEDVNLDQATAVFQNHETNKSTTVKADLIIGTDGAFSEVRHRMLRMDRFNYQQEFIPDGYKEITFPANEDGSARMRQDALHIWPRKSFMLMGLANLDGGFTGTLFFPFEGEPWSFEKIKNEADLMRFFKEIFPDAIPLIPDLTEQYFNNPTSSLVIIRCSPWNYKDKVALMGDAAHAIVPFYGEGMNCGFEDCFVFDQLIEKFYGDFAKVLPEYARMRKPNGDAIAELSLRNFIEMRDLVADPRFLLRRKIEGWFHEKHPDKWIPLYSQVKFSNIQYADALAVGKEHDAIMANVMALPDIELRWNSEEVEKRILQLIK
ncbi:MAG: FAD-dependent oxidoreductase, partial [Flavobacteriales bacterium]